ncbi:TPA: DnaA N-terminal domain-containing protein, partial [Bacillus cereus]
FHRDVLEGEYKDLISSTVQKVTNKKYNLWFYIESNTAPIAHVPNIQDNQLSSIHEGNETLWQEIKEKIQLQISRPSYETWVKKTTAHINGNALIIYFENEFQQQWVEKSYKDLISKIAEELTGNTYEIQFELQSNEIAIGIVETSKTSSNNDVFELWGQLKSANQDDKDKRIQALEEKIVSLEKMMSTLVGKLEVIESKTQLEK